MLPESRFLQLQLLIREILSCLTSELPELIDMAIPEQIDPTKLADYLEVMTRAVFQAGVSWKLVEKKWDAFREDFVDFEPEKVAELDQTDIDRLMQDARILRNKKRIEATIHNAKTMLALEKEYGTFQKYLRSKNGFEEISKDIRRRFKYVGELSVYYFLFRVKEEVPPFEEWIKTIEGDHPRMREMVELAQKNT